jgi:uncharacterized membrane protein (DUF2068 family)
MIAPPKHERAGLRIIAIFEAVKGLVVVAAGLGLLAFFHRDVQAAAAELVRDFHLDPASRIPSFFLHLAARLQDTRLWILALYASAYAVLRFAEAYGLWREKAWGEWVGIASGGIYIPVELYELSRRVTTVRVVLLAANLFIVAWLARVRWAHRKNVTASRSTRRRP